MSEVDRFEAWWKTLGVYDPALKAIAGSAWAEAIKADQPQPEAPDEWVEITDLEHVIRKCDQLSDYGTQWYPPSDFTRAVGKTLAKCGFAKVRCRRRDLPKAEQPEQWPKYYTTIDSPSSDVAFVKRVDETSYSVVYKNGRECPGFLWSAKNQSRRKQLTEDEAMALLKPTSNAYWSYHEKQKPQPKKTMLRLWIDSDCNIHAGLKGDRDLELLYDHETRQFYTEEPC